VHQSKQTTDRKLKEIESFLKKLRKVKHSDTVFNPYRQRSAVNNLRAYLVLLLEVSDIKMLIGEAPGYLGCRITGIPFTSGELLRQTSHPMLEKIKPELKFKTLESEATANYMWHFLEGKTAIPLLWNSFPFHPHHSGKPQTNRAPKVSEIAQGKEFLIDLYNIFQPTEIASIGRKGEKALNQAFPDTKAMYIRHPSYGGKADFIEGMNQLFP
jgi:uracil-DNA glycosylase